MAQPIIPISIRPAVSADVKAITALTNVAYEKYVPRMGLKPMPMLADYAQLLREAQLWVAELQGKCAGVLVLEAQPDHLLIYSIAVRPDLQKRGIGRQLMAFAEAETRRQGFGEIRLYTNIKMVENIEIYKQLGYTETHRDDYLGRIRVHMAKKLD